MWTLGSWPHEHAEFRVLELAPPGRDQPWVYVSAGTAHLRRFEGVGHEYVIRTWQQERLMVELLAMVASYSERADDDGLHDGHTVPIGARGLRAPRRITCMSTSPTSFHGT